MLHTMLQEYTVNGLFCVNRGSLQPGMTLTSIKFLALDNNLTRGRIVTELISCCYINYGKVGAA
jgi:hypothetical protein